MPITKAANKAMRQSRVRNARNQICKNRMKTMMKNILKHVKAGEHAEAQKLLSSVLSSIDMACKKNLIHHRNAAHKKSRVQKAVNMLTQKK